MYIINIPYIIHQYFVTYLKIINVYNRGNQREETREPPNILINLEEPICKKKGIILL